MRHSVKTKRGSTCAPSALILLALAAAPVAAGELDSYTDALGAWSIARLDGMRGCVVTFQAESTTAGHRVGMPPGCRRALPVLSAVDSWDVTQTRDLALTRASGEPVLAFAASDDLYRAEGPDGAVYELRAGARAPKAAPADQPAATLAGPAPAEAQIAQNAGPTVTGPRTTPGIAPPPAPKKPKPVATPESAAKTQPAASGPTTPLEPFTGRATDLAGRYAILREGKDMGCMLTLDERARGPHGTLKAQLAPACRDQGIVIFDPTGWQYERGKLALTARKGHEAHFEHHADDVWMKDPKEGGKPLGLKKL